MSWRSALDSAGQAFIYYRQFTAAGAPVGPKVELVRRDATHQPGATQVVIDNTGHQAVVRWMQPAGEAGVGYGLGRMLADPDVPGAGNQAPATSGIADVSVEQGATSTPSTTIPLFNAFEDDRDDDSALAFAVTGNSNPGLFSSVSIDPATGVLTLAYAPGVTGVAALFVNATDTGGLSTRAIFNVRVRPYVPPPPPPPDPGPGPVPDPGAGPQPPELPPLPTGDKSVIGRLVGKVKKRKAAGLEGVQVFLDANANGALDSNEPRTTTGAGGFYAFTGLAAMRFTVLVTVPDGWQPGGKKGIGAVRPVFIKLKQRKPAKVKPLVLMPMAPL